MNIQQIKDHLTLKPLPQEGGFYCETYRSDLELPSEVLPDLYTDSRSASTAIFYLLTPDSFSSMHNLPGDELYHFYLGNPVELLELHPEGTGEVTILGTDILNGMKVQKLVRGGTYQGARLKPGGDFALLGTTMSPGFEFEDFTPGNREELSRLYPDYADMINDLT